MLEEKRYSAAAVLLNVILHHIASTHKVGEKIEIYPLDENPHSHLFPKVYKKHVNGLLLTLGCIREFQGAICIKRDMDIWNNKISSHHQKNYEFTAVGPSGKNQKICLYIKQIPRGTSKDLIAVDDHRNIAKVRVHMQQSPFHYSDNANKILTDEQLQLLNRYKTDYIDLENRLKILKRSNDHARAVTIAVITPITASKNARTKRNTHNDLNNENDDNALPVYSKKLKSTDEEGDARAQLKKCIPILYGKKGCVKNFEFQKPYDQLSARRLWEMEDVFCKVAEELCKCINSSVDNENVSTVVRQLIVSKKVSKCFKHNDATKSDACTPHIQQVTTKKVATANKQASEIASLKEKIEELKKKVIKLQEHKRYHKNKDESKYENNGELEQKDGTQVGSVVLMEISCWIDMLKHYGCKKCGGPALVTLKSKGGNSATANVTCSDKNCQWNFIFENAVHNEGTCNHHRRIIAASLMNGLGYQGMSRIMTCLGVTKHLCKATYHDHLRKYKNKLYIEKKLEEHAQQSILRALTACALLDPQATELFVSGDNSWSHCRQAGESSFEFIAPSAFGEHKLKPVLACSLCMKELKGIGDINSSSEKVARVSTDQFTGTSGQMEDFNIRGALEQISRNLDMLSEKIMLNVVIDGDLDSLKILTEHPKVLLVYLDLTHKVKNIKKNCRKHLPNFSNDVHEKVWKYFRDTIFAAGSRSVQPREKDVRDILDYGLFNCMSNCHDKCWPELCLHARNDELPYTRMHLESFTDQQRAELKKGIKKLFATQPAQNLVTLVRTCENESFNNVKTRFLPKRMNFHGSFAIRYYLCLLNRNEGFLSTYETLIKLLKIPCLTSSDKCNIVINEIFLQNKRNKNQQSIEERNNMRAEKFCSLATCHGPFDQTQPLIPYLREYGVTYDTEEKPVPTTLRSKQQLFEYKAGTKCHACVYGIKTNHGGLGLCHVCYCQQIEPKSNEDYVKMLQLATGYSAFRSNQLEVIKAFVEGTSVIMRKMTSFGKSLIYVMPALIQKNTVFIVVSPTIALMQDQVLKMNSEYKIPSAMMCGGSDIEYRKSVFLEVAQRHVKILFVTPERFAMESFHLFLSNVQTELEMKLQFVIDEGHCLSNDYFNNNFRNCYGKITDIYKKYYTQFPIAIMSATITNDFATKLKEQLNLTKAPLVVLDKAQDLQRANLHFTMSKRNIANGKDVIRYINTHQEDKGIVYAGFPKNVMFLYNKLAEIKILPTRFFIYHSSLSFEEKETYLKEWRSTCNGVMICTCAFGMGIDVPDVKFILHDRSPFTVIDYVQESGRCQRGNEIGECVLYYNLSDISLINLITRNTTKSCQVLSFCERETLCRRVSMMHHIDPFADEETVRRNTCKNVAKQEAFCDVCRTGKEFCVLNSQDVLKTIEKLVAIVEEALTIEAEITIQDIADIYRINKECQTKFHKHSHVIANERDQCILKSHDLCQMFVRRLVAFNVLEGVMSKKKMFIEVNKSMVVKIENLDFLLLRYEVEV